MENISEQADNSSLLGEKEDVGEDGFRYDSFVIADNIEVANATLPAKPPTSGDFHAAFPLEDGSVAVVMGDVIGHGPEAAAHATTLLRAIGGCLIEGLPPSEALGFVNAAAEMSPEFDGFATVFAGTMNSGTGVLTYASGGHEPGLIAEPTNDDTSAIAVDPDEIKELDTTGPPLGVLGADEAQYEQRTVQISAGGTLMLYTDGITEARRGREMLGIVRLRKFMTRYIFLHPVRLVRKIIGYARAFTGQGRLLRDDAALMILRRRRKPTGRV